MNNEYFIQLSKIFNTLKLVHTCGEDTVLMSDCLRAIDSILQTVNNEREQEE